MYKPLRLSLFALAWLGGSVWAEVKISGETKVAPNHIVRLAAAGAPDGAACLWDVSPEDPVDVEEVGGRFLFTAPPGTYKVKLRTVVLSKEGKTTVETARATVVIGEPTPPTPPVPPAPVDPLASELQALFTADQSSDKAKNLAWLASLYKVAGKTIDDASLTTCGALQDKLHDGAASLMPDTALQPLRKRVGVEVVAVLGTNADAPLTPDVRKGMKALAARLADLLGGIK